MTPYARTIRRALLDAIDWRESMIAAGAGDAERNKRLKAEYVDLLKRRFGGVPADPFEGAKLVDVYNVRLARTDK